MISGFSEAWITPDLGRNVNEILPHSTPFLNGQPESLDIPSAIDRGTGIQIKTKEFWIYECMNFLNYTLQTWPVINHGALLRLMLVEIMWVDIGGTVTATVMVKA